MSASTILSLAWIFGGMTGWGLCRLFWLRERNARRRNRDDLLRLIDDETGASVSSSAR